MVYASIKEFYDIQLKAVEDKYDIELKILKDKIDKLKKGE